MKDPKLPSLPEDIDALLRTAKKPQMPSGFEARVLQRVQHTLASSSSGGLGDGGHGVSPLTAKLGSWGIPLSVATLVLGAAGGFWAGQQRADVEAKAPATSVPAPRVVPVPSEEIRVPAAQPEASAVRVDAGVAIVRPPAPPKPSSLPVGDKPVALRSRDVVLAEERALIEVARTALARRETEAALKAIQEHAEIHAGGQLAEERDSLWVQVLVNLGRFDEARAKADAFRRGHPDSMLLPSVEAALSSIPK